MVVAYFHPMRVICPILSGRLSQSIQGQWKPAKLSLPQNLSSRSDVPSVLSSWQHNHITMRRAIQSSKTKGSQLNVNWRFSIPPLIGTFSFRLWHSATSFLLNILGDHHSSLLQQTRPRIYGWIFHSCSKTTNSIFALTAATRTHAQTFGCLISSQFCDCYFFPESIHTRVFFYSSSD